MNHSGYYNLVSFIFGTTIPTSFNILMKCFLHLFYYFFLGIPSSVHFCFFVECLTVHTSHEPHPSTPTDQRAWAPPFYETWNAHARTKNGLDDDKDTLVMLMATTWKKG